MLLVLYCAVAFGHGSNYHILNEAGVGIQVNYHSGDPMNFCQVKIYSPASHDKIYQEGRTDKMGRFSFHPNQKGKWKIVVDDEMGHRLDFIVPVNKEHSPSKIEQEHIPKWMSALMGLAIIFGLFGLISLVYSRKNGKNS